MSSERDKLFTIQPDDHYGIYTGLTNDETQILVTQGIGAKFIGEVFVKISFDAKGVMTNFVEIPPLDLSFVVTHNPYENDARYEKFLEIALQKIGFETIQEIRVKKFFIPKHLIGIRQYPDYYQRFLEDGPEYTREEIEALRVLQANSEHYRGSFSEADLIGFSEQEDLEDRQGFENWKAWGDFVLWCQNDFWCNDEGYITAS